VLSAFRYQPFEKIAQVERNVRIDILLNGQRAGGVLHKQRKETVRKALLA